MPQLRWTLLCLGVMFVILLAWIERRRQRRQGFTDHSPVIEKESGQVSPAPMFREPNLTLPEMRVREPGPPHELPVVEIEDDSLKARRVEGRGSRTEPSTLSLPVLETGPVGPRGRAAEPTMSGVDLVKFERTDESGRSVGNLKVPTLDTPAPRGDSPTPKPGGQADKAPARAANVSTPGRKAGIGHIARPAASRVDPEDDAEVVDTSDSEVRAFNNAVFGDPSLNANRTEPDFSDEDAIAEGAVAEGTPAQGMSADAATAGAPPARRFTAADVTPVVDPIVEWPPDDQRRVVALRLVAAPPERLAGRALRLALASEGFVLGKFQIFHKPDENGRAVLSAASLSKPGTFDLGSMDVQRYGGLNLFAVLPGPRPPLKAFDDLLATARNLNERLQGALQDERGGPLTPTRIASMRESLAAETTS
jgi:cell division protein ZipA